MGGPAAGARGLPGDPVDAPVARRAAGSGSRVAGSPAAVYAQGGTDDPLMRLTGHSGGTDATVGYFAQDGLGSVGFVADALVQAAARMKAHSAAAAMLSPLAFGGFAAVYGPWLFSRRSAAAQC